MNFAGMNVWAIPAAALAAFLWGGLYYNLVSKPWMRAARLDAEAIKARPVWPAMLVSLLAELIMAWVLAGLIGHLGDGQVTLRNGLISGLFVWAGFMATTLAVNHRYQGFGWGLTVIDAVHWLGVVLLMGAVIGGLGV